jgi:hypothetical protein
VVAVTVTRAPSRLSRSLALLAGSGSLVGSSLGATDALPAGLVGLALLGGGLLAGSRRLATYGTAGLLVGVVVAGLRGAGPASLLVGLLGAVLAWDITDHGVSVGQHLGREADTRRVELVHAAASLLVGSVGAGVGYLVYVVATGGQPVSALVLLLVGVVVLVGALRSA